MKVRTGKWKIHRGHIWWWVRKPEGDTLINCDTFEMARTIVWCFQRER